MKRFLSITLALIITLAAFVPVFANSQDLYEQSGKILEDLKVLKGDDDGNLMLDKNLSRQDMVILISRLYGEEDKAKNFKGSNSFKDLTQARRFYIPYIAWAVDKGLIEGMGDNIFGFNEETTVQQFQTVLLRALGYANEAKEWKLVPEYAKTLGIMENLNLSAGKKLLRGEMATMVLNTLKQEKKGSHNTLAETLKLKIPELFTVDVNAVVDKNSITFEGNAKGTSSLKLNLKPVSSGMTSNERLVDIPLKSNGSFTLTVQNLESGTYNYRFLSGSTYTSYKSITISELNFDLVKVEADNLKEIVLTFTQAVDKNIAGFVSNYTTTAGTIRDVRFEDNDTKVILTLNGVMQQQGRYKITANTMKSAKGGETKVKDVEFNVFDNKPPKVQDVVQLGTKGLKIIFSEPIKSATSNNFKIDGKNVSGTVKLENNIVTLTYYSSFGTSLGEGKHILNVTGIEDFASYRGIDDNIEFVIRKDTTPPTVVGATATLEEVIVEFNEDIDPVSAVRTNFYWKVGNSKRYADKVVFVNNKAYVDFTNNKLSYSDNTIYVENIVDYSNNKMKSTSVKVKPVLDTTSPEVINFTVAENGRSITVFFSKNVDGRNRSYYTLTDRNNKNIPIRDIQGSGREFTINLYNVLPVGSNSLTVQGVLDTTPVRNPMIPFSTIIDMKDIEPPKVLSSMGYGNHIMVKFSKPMDFSTLSNPSNYIITFNNTTMYLPIDTFFSPGDEGTSVTMILPDEINNKKVMVGAVNNLTSLTAWGLKDVNGNNTDPLQVQLKFDGDSSGKAKAVDYYHDQPGKQGVLLEDNVVKIRFNVPIALVDKSDFTIVGRTISYAVADHSSEVTIYLEDSDNTGVPSISISPVNNIRTYIDTGVAGGAISLIDKVPPRVKSNINYLSTSGSDILLPFTEDLEETGVPLYANDLEVIRHSDGKLLEANKDYSTSLGTDKSVLRIRILNGSINAGYSVGLIRRETGTVNFIRDAQLNLAISTGESFTTR